MAASPRASMPHRLTRRIAAALAIFGVTACAPSTAMLALERGDRGALHEDLATRERLGDLGRREAAALSKAVAEREIATAAPDDALDRLRDLRSCARELDDSLAVRMRTHDAAGAEAALARIESGGLNTQDARAFLADADPHWRAVGVRGLVRPEDRGARLSALIDPSPAVRRQAARAAHDAADPDDLSALSEAARLDPDAIVRTEAVQAIAALPAAPSIEARRAIMDALRDLWTIGGDDLREDIAVAWSRDVLWGEGGREELRTIVATGHGAPAIEAAAAVLRRRDTDTQTIALASSQLANAIRNGVTMTRLQALAEAPLDRPDLVAAARVAAGDDDRTVRLAALSRLAAANDRHASAELEGLASPESSMGSRARIASAMAGDRRVQKWVEDQLTSDREEDRIAAAVALAALGVAPRAATLLADPVPRVRARTSCVILMAARTTHS
jgi:hypothetical protein